MPYDTRSDIKLNNTRNETKPNEPNLINVSNSNIDWTKERAEAWHKMKPPSRPSDSELEIYRKFFQNVKHTKSGAGKPRALILGSTVEFRELAAQEDFEITVVDYSEEYHNEISTELNTKKYKTYKEQYIKSDWCNMHNHSELSAKKFDIIIGDLSIGNVAPERIQNFYNNINSLLEDTGYFLGKSLYIYSDYKLNTPDEMNALLTNMLDKESINKENIYSYIMYPLSVYASEFHVDQNNEIRTCKINFQTLYNYVFEYVQGIPRNKQEQKAKFSIYLDETTKFNSKMPKDFYIYSYRDLLAQLETSELYIEDIVYSKEVYKNDFPLLIIRKGKEISRSTISVNTFLGEIHNENLDIWKNAISSKYFLSQIDDCISKEELLNHIKDLLNNATIEVDKNLNDILSEIPEKTLHQETQSLTTHTNINNSEDLKYELQFNYTCAILLSIIDHCKRAYKLEATVVNLLLRTLFSHKIFIGRIWKPYESPWVTARICICLFPIYQQWKSKKKLTGEEDEYIKKLEDAVKILAEKNIEPTGFFWESETGSHFDTSALCIETLYLYSKYMQNENLKRKINLILNKYVRNDHIKETFIKYPIFSNLIEEVCANKNINGKPAYKKLGGRIEWYSILYIICKDWGESDNSLTDASEYIAKQLKKFWGIFREKADDIIKITIIQENSLVPQILYCLERTNLFD